MSEEGNKNSIEKYVLYETVFTRKLSSACRF